MSNETHACSLTVEEINSLITEHAGMVSRGQNMDFCIERMNYLSKRLRNIKAKEAEVKPKGWDLK